MSCRSYSLIHSAISLPPEPQFTCRICWDHHECSPLLTPCRCRGTAQHVHHECLAKWIALKHAAHPMQTVTCELCGTPFLYSYTQQYQCSTYDQYLQARHKKLPIFVLLVLLAALLGFAIVVVLLMQILMHGQLQFLSVLFLIMGGLLVITLIGFIVHGYCMRIALFDVCIANYQDRK